MYFYSTGPILKNLFEEQRTKEQKDRLLIFKAMLKHSTIYSTEIEERWRSEIFGSFSIRVKTDYSEQINRIADDPSVVLEMPPGIYLVDLDFSKRKLMKEAFGTIVIPMTDKPDGQYYLYLNDKNIEFSPASSKVYKNGWNTVLTDLAGYPSTAMIFIDRYMFANYIEDAIQNIHEILEMTLPKTFSENHQYHLTFIFDINKLVEMDFEKLSSKVDSDVRTIRPGMKMQVELMGITSTYTYFYNDSHNRRIISNYFIIRADNAIRAFRKSTKKNEIKYNYSNCLQTLTPQRLYTRDCLDTQSDAPVISIINTIESIRDFSSFIKKKSSNYEKYMLYSLNGKTIKPKEGVKNRLILK